MIDNKLRRRVRRTLFLPFRVLQCYVVSPPVPLVASGKRTKIKTERCPGEIQRISFAAQDL